MLRFNHNPDQSMLRWFAWLQLVFAMVIVWLFRHRLSLPVAGIVLVVSLNLAALSNKRPSFVRPLWIVWTALAWPIGWIISHVLLALAYYGILTPIAIILRRLRGDQLGGMRDSDFETYWKEREPDRPADSYLKQY